MQIQKRFDTGNEYSHFYNHCKTLSDCVHSQSNPILYWPGKFVQVCISSDIFKRRMFQMRQKSPICLPRKDSTVTNPWKSRQKGRCVPPLKNNTNMPSHYRKSFGRLWFLNTLNQKNVNVWVFIRLALFSNIYHLNISSITALLRQIKPNRPTSK